MGLGLDPCAIHTDLARAGHLLDLDVVQIGPAALEPSVQPHAVFTGIHEKGADFFHANRRLATIKPANRAATDRSTDAET